MDSGFATHGIAVRTIGTAISGAGSMALQPNGKILLGGTSTSGTVKCFTLARFDSTGGIDTGFGTGGVVTTVFSGGASELTSLALQADGKIVAGGKAPVGIALARYTANGAIDSTFGTAGMVTVNQGLQNGTGLSIQTGGKIIMLAEASPNPYNFAILRFNSHGVLGSSFSMDGIDTTDILGKSRDKPASSLIQSDGKSSYADSPARSPPAHYWDTAWCVTLRTADWTPVSESAAKYSPISARAITRPRIWLCKKAGKS